MLAGRIALLHSPWAREQPARRSQRTRLGSVWRNELREIEWHVFMDRTISHTKQFTENTVMYRQPVQLSESGGDVTLSSAFWTACRLLICVVAVHVGDDIAIVLLGQNQHRLPYWAVQEGLFTPLTFARHRLSPLAAFTSGAYFLHNGSDFANFILPTLKTFLEVRSQKMSGNKQ